MSRFISFRKVRTALVAAVTVLLVLPAGLQAAAQNATQTTTETLVIFRHGEKPPMDLGQLTCKGLNRALALPPVLNAKFGRPDYLFAPDPAIQVHDGHNGPYSYVRPLATIEPTAIRLGMNVNAQIGFTQIDQLQQELAQPQYANAKVFIAWEHGYEEAFTRNLLKSYGADPSQVPHWSNSDYDSIYVVRLTRTAGNTTASFTLDHEGLDGKLSDACPAPAQ